MRNHRQIGPIVTQTVCVVMVNYCKHFDFDPWEDKSSMNALSDDVVRKIVIEIVVVRFAPPNLHYSIPHSLH